MHKNTRIKFNASCNAIAKNYGVDTVAQTYSATPTIEQKLMDREEVNSNFLQMINVLPVTEQQGQKVLGGVSGIVGKRTNTATKDRETQDPLGLTSGGYDCQKSEFDIHILYDTLNAWAKFPDFYQRFDKYVRKAIALAKISTGFHGISRAIETDPATNPNGEDLHKGWIQKLREYEEGSQVFSEGNTAGQIRLGAGGDFVNLDSAVHSCLQLVGETMRDDGDLIAIVGRDLLALDKASLYAAQGQTPTEKERVENNAVTKTYGSLPAMNFGKVPSRFLMVTSLDNLSIYYQEGSVRQKIEDNSKRDRIEHYNTINLDYVVENEEKCGVFDFKNIKLKDAEGDWG